MSLNGNSCATCTSGDYTERIYDSRRANFYDYACAFSFANGNATFGGDCSRAAKEAEAARKASEPTLLYRQPNSYAEYLSSVHSLAASTKQPFQVVGGGGESGGGGGTTSSSIVDPQRCTNCQPCSIVPCGSGRGSFSEGCGPQPQFERRMRYNGGAPYKPASALPILNRYQWSQPASMYVFDSAEERQQAFDGIYNGNNALQAKFNFQNPKEQQRLWYGIGESRSPASTRAEPVEPKFKECGNVPVPYYRNYLDSKYACGCNQRRCTGGCV